jgi:hypothetical protein
MNLRQLITLLAAALIGTSTLIAPLAHADESPPPAESTKEGDKKPAEGDKGGEKKDGEKKSGGSTEPSCD